MKTVLITGATGAIGQGLCQGFKDAGYYVIGTDLGQDKGSGMDVYIPIDLDLLCRDDSYREQAIESIRCQCDRGLDVLINNAANQTLNPVKKMSLQDWNRTMNVNLNSAFILIQALLPSLESTRGNVINIASIHAELTKPEFSAYATSKAGLIGLTKSLAVELGLHVKVNAISPAAVSTPMLEEGFLGNQDAREKLDSYHPVGKVGSVDDVVSVAMYLSNSCAFVNGAVINLDGGISSRLYDPM